MKRASIRVLSTLAMLGVALAARPEASGAFDAQIASPDDYGPTLDAETDGLLTRLLDARDTGLSIEHYDALRAAYSRIEDELVERRSEHANQLPGWFATQLQAIGLDQLGESDAPAVAFFMRQLQHADLDAVLLAYDVLGRSGLPLVSGRRNEPTRLWTALVETARKDPEQRFWISLALAEQRLFRDAATYAALGTREATRDESLRQAIGRSARVLGAQIYRVPGIDDAEGPHVAHFQIDEARRRADERVATQQLLGGGESAAYDAIVAELDRLETQVWLSDRFLEITSSDLPRLLEAFGPPDDPEALLDRLDRLYEARGEERLRLRIAIGELRRLYAPRIQRMVLADDDDTPMIGADALRAMPNDEAVHFVVEALEDPDETALISHLFALKVIPTLAGRTTDARQRAKLRSAVLAGYHRLGHPQRIRARYFDALDALPPTSSSEFRGLSLDDEGLTALVRAFEAAVDRDTFRQAMRSLQNEIALGKLPEDGRLDPRLTAAFFAATNRLLGLLDADWRRAVRDVENARVEAKHAAARISAAEVQIAEFNHTIIEANDTTAEQEARHDAAVARRNDAVRELNEIVAAHEAAVRALEKAHGSGSIDDDRDARVARIRRLQIEEAEARDRAKTAETRLSGVISESESKARRALAVIDDAQERARYALGQAKRAKAAVPDAIRDENGALEREQASVAEERAARRAIESLLARVLLALESMGVRADAAQLGRADGDRDARMAALLTHAIDAAAGAPDSGSLDAVASERALGDAVTMPIARAILELRASAAVGTNPEQR